MNRDNGGGYPVTFRLPPFKAQDQYFGFTRAYYYEGERRGYWKLIHIKDPKRARGITLVPFDQVLAFVQKKAGKP